MSKKESVWLWDADEVEQRMREREEYIAGLFIPILPVFQHKERTWLVEGLIPESCLTVLAAEPKEGKTSLATAIGIAVATGGRFAGMPARQGAVLWISAEESPRERAYLLDQSPWVDTACPIYTCYQHLPVDDPDSLDALQRWVYDTEAKLIVVDPLLAATSGRSLRDGWNARRSLQALKRFCDMTKCAALVLHHRKDAKSGIARSRAAENDQISATASLIMSMRVKELDDTQAEEPRTEKPSSQYGPRLIALDCVGRADVAKETVWLLSRGPLDYVRLNGPIESLPAPTLTPTERDVMAVLAVSPATSVDIHDQWPGLRPGTLRNALTRLKRFNWLQVDKNEEGHRVYSLTDLGRTYVLESESFENAEPSGKTPN